KRVIDYGCGSGILAIAAALLGASEVLAVDNDPQALLATRNNCSQNQIPATLLTVWAPDQLPREPVHLLLANILAEPLAELALHFASLVQAGGDILLSGVLDGQVDSLLQHYRDWFDIEEVASDSGWARIRGIRIGRRP
ncbi:MAG: 50S ribosomal protein L11 methyltransferase, partial [Gammaproteobacteria bacterium]